MNHSNEYVGFCAVWAASLATDMASCLSEDRARYVAAAFCFLDEEDYSDSECLIAFAVHKCMLHGSNPKKARHRQKEYTDLVVASFRLDEFKTFFRVSKTSVQYLLELICSICREQSIEGIMVRKGTGGSPQISLDQRILCFLWYMSSLDKYASIADRFGIAESTACAAIHNLMEFLKDNLTNKIIVWPTATEKEEIKDMFQEVYNFPGVIGMVDGTHIEIRRPHERGVDYYNRKDFYSVVLQGCVREDLRFTNICAGWPGKVHDARVFRNSQLFETGQQICGEDHILGDSAYPILPWLLTPFRDTGHLTAVQKKFNQKQSAIRSAVERAFGLLKGRFTRLRFLDQRNTGTIVSTIVSGCILHNICILTNDEFLATAFEDNPLPQQEPDDANFDAAQQLDGTRKRLAIARQL